MKLPSLQKLQQATVEVLFRFPLEIFSATTGTGLMLWQIENNQPDSVVLRIILCSVLGLALFLASSVFSESRAFTKKQRSLLQIGVALVLVACYFVIEPIESETSIIRYTFFLVAFHLLVAVAPLSTIEGFWEYNKQLFIRILTAQLYSWVLFAGLCIAVASADFLFTLDIDSKIYLRLYILIIGLFNTIFFLAGVPHITENLEQQYPKGLKVFTQYVLIPLATIYLLIILTYEGKVLLEWSLPKGIISWLILGYAVYGILSILLVYPVRMQEENKWISNYSRWFYFLLIPLLPLLSLAIGVRVWDYGITELRYTVLLLTLWLTGITFYFLISKNQNIKIIPLTLALLALISAWGPQSASSVSQRSQVNRLVHLFASQNSYRDGVLQPVPATMSDSVGNEVVDQLRYIVDQYGVASLKDKFSPTLNDSLVVADTIKNRYWRNSRIMEKIREHLSLKSYYSTGSYYTENYFAETSEDSILLTNYRYMKNLSYEEYREESKVHVRGDTLIVNNQNEAQLYFLLSKVYTAVENNQAREGKQYPNLIPQASMTAKSIRGKETTIFIRTIRFSKDSTQHSLEGLEAILLFK